MKLLFYCLVLFSVLFFAQHDESSNEIIGKQMQTTRQSVTLSAKKNKFSKECEKILNKLNKEIEEKKKKLEELKRNKNHHQDRRNRRKHHEGEKSVGCKEIIKTIIGMGLMELVSFVVITKERDKRLRIFTGYVSKEKLTIYNKPQNPEEVYPGLKTPSDTRGAFTFNSQICFIQNKGDGVCYDPKKHNSFTGQIYKESLGYLNIVSGGEAKFYGIQKKPKGLMVHMFANERSDGKVYTIHIQSLYLCITNKSAIFSSKKNCKNDFENILTGFVYDHRAFLLSKSKVYIFRRTILEFEDITGFIAIKPVSKFVNCKNSLATGFGIGESIGIALFALLLLVVAFMYLARGSKSSGTIVLTKKKSSKSMIKPFKSKSKGKSTKLKSKSQSKRKNKGSSMKSKSQSKSKLKSKSKLDSKKRSSKQKSSSKLKSKSSKLKSKSKSKLKSKGKSLKHNKSKSKSLKTKSKKKQA